MLPHGSHITRKRGLYFYRRRLPRPRSGELTLSLRTRRYREAEYRAELLDHAYSALAREPSLMSHPDLPSILRAYLRELLDSDLEQHHATPPGRAVYARSLEPNEHPLEADIAVVHSLLDEAEENLVQRNVKAVKADTDRLMAEHQLPKDQRIPLALGLLRAQVQRLERSMERLSTGATEAIVVDEHQPTHPRHPQATEGSQSTDGPKLSDVLPGFVERMVRDKGWRGQTRAQNETTYRMFIEVVGDRSVQSYKRRDFAAFHDLLRALPALYSKRAEWHGMSLRAIAEATKGREDIERLTMKTAKRHFSALGALFTDLKRREEYQGENPAYGFFYPRRGRADEDKPKWPPELLERLFESPVWTGCHSKARRSTPGRLIYKDAKYWLPLLGIFQGSRLEELAQLRREDMGREDDIRYFNISDEGERQLKNAQSRRRVPIHPRLIELGFLDYACSTAHGPDDLLFPTLKPGGPDRKLGASFSKWFTRYRQDIDIYKRGYDFQAFRHTVTTKLFDAGVPDAHVDELTGHAGKGTSRTVYNKGASLQTLYEAICKVDWPEIKL